MNHECLMLKKEKKTHQVPKLKLNQLMKKEKIGQNFFFSRTVKTED